MIHHTPEAVRADMQERLRVACQQREITAAVAEGRRMRRDERAFRPRRLCRTLGALRRTAQRLRRAAVHSLRPRNSKKARPSDAPDALPMSGGGLLRDGLSHHQPQDPHALLRCSAQLKEDA